MSQQHLGRRSRLGGRAASLLAPAVAGSLLLLAAGPPAQAAPTSPAARQSADITGQKYAAGTYLVQLADQPVATYGRTAPEPGEKVNPRSQAVRDHLGRLKQARDQVLDEVRGVTPLYSYQYVLNGFSAKLTGGQAAELARTPGVVSLARSEANHLVAADTMAGTPTATTAGSLPPADTVGFLGLKKPGGLYSKIPGGQRNAGEGMIIGLLDSGIDTDNPSLRALPEPRPDAEVIAKKWKGGCDPGDDPAHRVTCNNKVIGAQYFNKDVFDPGQNDWPSPMDAEAHGTHTATTAAGFADVPASVPDTAISGRISGTAPAARIAAYKVCWNSVCGTADIVAAMDRAVADGVDVINYSIAGAFDEPANRPEYMALFNAAKAGVFISAASGNSGPGTAANGIPWVTTVAASTHDVGYRTTVTLGDGASYSGVGTSASAVPSAPLVDAAKAGRSGVDATAAGQCRTGTLDPDQVKGALVLCAYGGVVLTDKSDEVKAAGGAGMVLYNVTPIDAQIAGAYTVPSVHVDRATGLAIRAYADGTGATAGLGAARAVHQEVPEVANFSSSGPDVDSGGDLLQPDVTAPGVDITAGTTPGGSGGAFKGEQGLMSGTSMSTPHVTGLALLLRQLHPDWSPMEVKSALMTTATTKDSAGRPIQRSGAAATPLDYGAGHVAPNPADDPGLVYDSTSADWTAYLCALGRPPVTAADGDACATARKTDPSDLNSPTISVGDLAGKQTVTRTVTNVSATTGVYTATLRTPPGYEAQLSPKRLVVPPGGSATYQVAFTSTDAAFGKWSYGSVSWSDKTHQVRSAVALRASALDIPAETTGEGATGSVTFTPKVGFDGTLTTTVRGLYAGTVKSGTLTGVNTDFDPSSPSPSVAQAEFTVPEGAGLARVAILSAEHLAGSDLDLWVLDKDGHLLTRPGSSNDEHADLEPGTYTVYVIQYALPPDVTSQTYTLHTWLIGPDTPDHPATVTPATHPVSRGDTVPTTVSWRNLPAGGVYLGLVGYGDGPDTVGITVLTVTP
ncbi:S8 family serine peptidase [Streptomyces sp. NBC_00280]|uniref:S8 family serine peptidase n=1 Tax=Streptomyces sp. NBC_00280 TaxID=2975699 RepID=UPI00324FB6B0